jgi:hypothetical protein
MKHFFTFLAAVLVTASTYSQVGIGKDTPDASAVLDLSNAGNQGFILPRMTTTERDADIKSPKAGILIYNTTTVSFQVSQVSTWLDINTNTTTAVSTGISSNTGIVGIGTVTPDSNTALDVVSDSKGILLPSATADPTGIAGMIYYNTTTNTVKGYTTSWIDLF